MTSNECTMYKDGLSAELEVLEHEIKKSKFVNLYELSECTV